MNACVVQQHGRLISILPWVGPPFNVSEGINHLHFSHYIKDCGFQIIKHIMLKSFSLAWIMTDFGAFNRKIVMGNNSNAFSAIYLAKASRASVGTYMEMKG